MANPYLDTAQETDAEFQSRLSGILNRKAPAPPPPKRGIVEDAITHFAIGANKYVAQPIAGIAEMTGRATGIKPLEDLGKTVGDNADAWIAAKEAESPSQKFADINGVDDAARWAGELLMEFVPQALVTLGTSGAGAAAGRAIAGTAARSGIASLEGIAGKKAIQAATANTGRALAADEVASLAANRAGIAGAQAAMGTGAIGMETSAIYRDQDPAAKDMGRALLYGTAAGILDTAFPAWLMQKTGLTRLMPGMGKVAKDADALTGTSALTTGQRVKDVAKIAGIGTGTESVQEGVQTVLENIGANKYVYSDEVKQAGGTFGSFLKVAGAKGIRAAVNPAAWSDIVESMAAGGLIGGVMGGGASTVGHVAESRQQANAAKTTEPQATVAAAAEPQAITDEVAPVPVTGIADVPATGTARLAADSGTSLLTDATPQQPAGAMTKALAAGGVSTDTPQLATQETPQLSELDHALAWAAGKPQYLGGVGISETQRQQTILNDFRKAQAGGTSLLSDANVQPTIEAATEPVKGGVPNEVPMLRQEVGGPQGQVPAVRGETVKGGGDLNAQETDRQEWQGGRQELLNPSAGAAVAPALQDNSGIAAVDHTPAPSPTLLPATVEGRTAAPSPAGNRRVLDPTKDTLLVAVAKLGGVSRQELGQQAGSGKELAGTLNLLAGKEARGFMHVVSTKGLPLDTMREKLVEHGYLPEGATINDLIDRLDDAQRGRSHYSTSADFEADANNAYDAEVQRRLEAHLAGMTDEDHADLARNQWLDEQAGLLADAGDILDEYLAGFDEEQMTAADWQEVENDFRRALDEGEQSAEKTGSTETAAEPGSAGSRPADTGETRLPAAGPAGGVHAVGAGHAAGEDQKAGGEKVTPQASPLDTIRTMEQEARTALDGLQHDLDLNVFPATEGSAAAMLQEGWGLDAHNPLRDETSSERDARMQYKKNMAQAEKTYHAAKELRAMVDAMNDMAANLGKDSRKWSEARTSSMEASERYENRYGKEPAKQLRGLAVRNAKKTEIPPVKPQQERVSEPASKSAPEKAVEVQTIAEPAPAKGFGNSNTVFTSDKADRARAILKSKLTQLNAGLDPEMIQAGIDLAGYYIEGGARSFAAYSKKMVEDLGEAIRPFLKSFYLAVRNYPGFDKTGMETEAQVESSLEVQKVEAAIAPLKKAPKGERRLRGDYGVKHIDAYSDAGEKAKAAFLADARGFLKDVAAQLTAEGWSSEKVHVSEGGVAVSGDVSLVAFKDGQNHGIYVTIGGGVGLPMVSESPSNVRIMYRANTRKDKYGGKVNRWDAPWNVTSGDLAAMLVAEANRWESKETTPSAQKEGEKQLLRYGDFMQMVYDRLEKSQPLRNAAINSDRSSYELEYMSQYKRAVTNVMMENIGTRNVAEAHDAAIKNTREMLYGQMDRLRDRFRNEKIDSTEAVKLPEKAAETTPALSVTLNAEHNGVELHFAEKPSPEIITRVKAMGFRWSMRQKVWYAKDSAIRRQFAERLATELNGTSEKVTSPEPAPAERPSANHIVDTNEMVATEDPAAAIATFVQDKLKAKEKITFPALVQEAQQAYGSKLSEGKFDIKDVYDAMELGVNRTIRDSQLTLHTAVSLKRAETDVSNLQHLLDLLPTQTRRTAEMEEFQQFSTPPTLAYVAAWAAKILPEDTVAEPSAGVGGLAVFAKNAGATVYANELSPRRLALLKTLNFDKIFNENAEQFNNVMPKDVRPTVVLMNPPFSSTAGRITGQRKTSNGALHIEQALKRLEPGGRLVAIVGEGMAAGRPAFRDWWKKIEGEYSVRANLGVEKGAFVKYGTNFGTQLLVIDKTGSTVRPPVTAQVATVEELLPHLEGVRNDRRRVEQSADEQSSPQPAAPSRGETRPDRTVSDTTGGVGTEQRSLFEQPAGDHRPESTGTGVAPAAATSAAGVRDARGGSAGQTETGSRTTAGKPVRVDGGEEPALAEPSGVAVEAKKAEKATGQLTDSVFERYTPQRLAIPGAHPHPGHLVQSAAMATVEPPAPTYQPKLPREVITNGKLSIAQLESVVYAGQAHQQILPNGDRRGFFIGDGTGVGKGREISGIILDNLNQGRTKAVWISERSALITDARRDFSGVGADSSLIFDLSKTKLGKDVANPKGVLFTTYSTLGSGLEVSGANGIAGKGGKSSRLDQIVQWVGPDFDGVIAFDEAHNMQSAVAEKGKRGMKKASLQGLAGVELQKRLPKARIIYVSATGATNVANLAYGERLGLWGEGTPFPNKTEFINQIQSGGVAAMELVARDMKAMGVYLARSLSYDDVQYARLEHVLTTDQEDIYNELAKAWQVVLGNIDQAIAETRAELNSSAKSAAYSAFWGAQQRFFNQIITSMQMPAVLEDVAAQIDQGKAAVLQLVNTNEAVQDRQLAQMEPEASLEDLDMTPRENLMQFIENSFPTQQFEEYEDDEGNIRSRPVVDASGNPVQNAEAVAMKEALLDRLGAIKVPDGPIELLLNQFGAEAVAEVTGRGQRIVYRMEEGVRRKVVEKRGRSAAEADADAFMADKKQILVFSDAGGTGRSYHADLSKINQRQRVHYLVQPGWRADKAVQGFGRTHRTNQASAPEYKLVSTNLKGQRRFISSIARRLDQLGALTKGERRTGSQGLFKATDNLESEYATNALQRLVRDSFRGEEKRIDFADIFQTKMGLRGLIDERSGTLNETRLPSIPQFLNRILSLEIPDQNRLFDAFFERLEQNIHRAEENGTLETGLENYHADKVAFKGEQNVYREPKSGAETKYVQMEASHKVQKVTFKEATKLRNFMGFYRNLSSGKVWAALDYGTATNSKGSVIEEARLVGQTARQSRMVDQYELNRTWDRKWEKLDEADARPLWDEQLAKAKEYHTENLHMISGTILPIWDRLPTGSKAVRVLRVQTDEGQRYLGRLIPEDAVNGVLRNLGATPNAMTYTASDVLERVQSGGVAELANGWRLKSSLVAGGRRVELVGNDLWKYEAELAKAGVFKERHQFQTRYFVPPNEESIAAVTASRPVVEISGGSSANFALVDWSSSGVPVADAQQWVTTLPFADRVNVVEFYDDLPEAAQAEIEKSGLNPRRVQAMELKGTLHVIADHIPDMTRVRTLVMGHELAHAGQTEKIVDLAVDWFKRTKDGNTEQARTAQAMLRQVAQRYKYNLEDEAQFRRAVKEATAAIAEQAVEGNWKPAGLIARIFMYLKHWLRQNGLISHVSDSELSLAVAEMLRLGEKRLSTGLGGETAQMAAAWHGSPHRFDRFSTDNIGTGEGAQAYGYGLYFAGKKEVAEWYRDKLRDDFSSKLEVVKNSIASGVPDGIASKIVTNLIHENMPPKKAVEAVGWASKDSREFIAQHKDALINAATAAEYTSATGRLYQVELAPKEDEYLLWDKPLSEQSEKVQEALEERWTDTYSNSVDEEDDSSKDPTGSAIYRAIAMKRGVSSNIQGQMSAYAEGKRLASDYLHSLGIRGIKYLDGTSRNRPLRDIKQTFLDALPEDATFEDVTDMIGTGQFTPEQERFLKALENDDWLGFDYPAQAISAALGKNLAGFDPSDKLKAAINGLQVAPTYNYVIFNDSDVQITAHFALRDTLHAVRENLAAPEWGTTTANVKQLLNPLDWSRATRVFQDYTPPAIQRGIAAMLRNPVFEAEKDPRKQPLVKTAENREISRMDLMLKLMGWQGTGEMKNAWQRVRDYFTKWDSAETRTTWGDIRKRYYALSRAQQKALDTILVEGDIQGRSYGSLEKALTNPRIKAANPEPATFQLFRDLRRHIDGHVADERNKIVARLYMEIAKDQSSIATLIEELAPEQQAKLDAWLSRWSEEGHIYDEAPANSDDETWAAYEAIRDFVKPRYVEHVNEARRRQAELTGWMTRHHGEGEYAAKVYHIINRLNFVSETTGTGRQRSHLNYYPGSRIAGELETMADNFGLMAYWTPKGELIVQQNEEEQKGTDKPPKYTGDMKAFLGAVKRLDLKNEHNKFDRVPVYVRYFETKAGARQQADKARKDLKAVMPNNYREGMTYETRDFHIDKLTETMYGDLKSDAIMEYAQELALKRALARGEITKEEYASIRDQVMLNTAEVLMGRAAGRYQIRRAQYLIEGYDTDNTLQLYTDYLTGIAGMYSKALYAREQLKNFQEADGETKIWAHPYIQDSLRNMGFYDRMSGVARSIATFMYLGFKPASVLINATQPWTLGIAELGKIAKSPGGLLLKSQKDIFAGNLTADERELFAGAVYLTQEMETAVAEMGGLHEGIKGQTGMWWQRIMQKAMAPFQEVEMLNRKSTILAAYRALRDKNLPAGTFDKKAMEGAMEVNRKVNFEMSRANLPKFARNPLGRSVYALQGFAFNTLNNLYNKLTSGEKEDMVAVLRYLAATAVIGGAMALPGGDEADRLLKRLTGRSVKLDLQTWMRKHAKEYGTIGEALNDFAWHGVPAMTVGVNVSNSLRMQLPFVSALLGGESLPESAAGVFAGLAQKGEQAATFAGRGNTYRVAESLAPEAVAGPMRAYRQMAEGVTTTHGKKVFDEHGQPVKYSGLDAAKRTVGLQPLRQSERTELATAERDIQKEWNEKRIDVLDRLRGAKTTDEIREANREMMKFNASLNKSQAKGIVSPITMESMRRTRIAKPDKKQTAWLRNNLE